MERLVSIDSLKIVPHDRRSLAALGMTWGVTKPLIFVLSLVIPALAGIYFWVKVMSKFGDGFQPVLQ